MHCSWERVSSNSQSRLWFQKRVRITASLESFICLSLCLFMNGTRLVFFFLGEQGRCHEIQFAWYLDTAPLPAAFCLWFLHRGCAAVPSAPVHSVIYSSTWAPVGTHSAPTESVSIPEGQGISRSLICSFNPNSVWIDLYQILWRA